MNQCQPSERDSNLILSLIEINLNLACSLLSLQGQEWRDRRVKLSPIFTSGKMKMMFNTVDTISDRLVNVINSDLEKSKTLEMRVLAAKFTADVIGNVAFGLECKCMSLLV